MTVCVAGAWTAPAQSSAPPPARAVIGTAIGVTAREFSLAVYRRRVEPGVVRFNVENLGEDRHNLQVRGPGPRSTRVVATSEDIRSGRRLTLPVTLRRRGTYTLVCTIADHEVRGMRTRIVVTKRP